MRVGRNWAPAEADYSSNDAVRAVAARLERTAATFGIGQAERCWATELMLPCYGLERQVMAICATAMRLLFLLVACCLSSPRKRVVHAIPDRLAAPHSAGKKTSEFKHLPCWLRLLRPLRAWLDPGALACKLLNAFASTSPPAELVVLLGALTAGQGINSLTPPLKNRQRRLAGRSIGL